MADFGQAMQIRVAAWCFRCKRAQRLRIAVCMPPPHAAWHACRPPRLHFRSAVVALALCRFGSECGCSPTRARRAYLAGYLAQHGIHVFVSDDLDCIAATCMLITAPNLLGEGRRHAFLENVVTHPGLRGRGHGKAVVRAALAHAWATDCHHVLMQSGRPDPRAHAFYERLGFEPGLRVAYVARRTAASAE